MGIFFDGKATKALFVWEEFLPKYTFERYSLRTSEEKRQVNLTIKPHQIKKTNQLNVVERKRKKIGNSVTLGFVLHVYFKIDDDSCYRAYRSLIFGLCLYLRFFSRWISSIVWHSHLHRIFFIYSVHFDLSAVLSTIVFIASKVKYDSPSHGFVIIHVYFLPFFCLLLFSKTLGSSASLSSVHCLCSFIVCVSSAVSFLVAYRI